MTCFLRLVSSLLIFVPQIRCFLYPCLKFASVCSMLFEWNRRANDRLKCTVVLQDSTRHIYIVLLILWKLHKRLDDSIRLAFVCTPETYPTMLSGEFGNPRFYEIPKLLPSSTPDALETIICHRAPKCAPFDIKIVYQRVDGV